jgi:hypothetical protein
VALASSARGPCGFSACSRWIRSNGWLLFFPVAIRRPAGKTLATAGCAGAHLGVAWGWSIVSRKTRLVEAVQSSTQTLHAELPASARTATFTTETESSRRPQLNLEKEKGRGRRGAVGRARPHREEELIGRGSTATCTVPCRVSMKITGSNGRDGLSQQGGGF